MHHELPPHAHLMQLITGRWVSQTVTVAAEHRFADHLASGPKTAEEIARAAGTNPDATYRVLRALASVGVFAEGDGGRFTNTPTSEVLRSDRPDSMRAMAQFINLPNVLKAWGQISESVRTGKSAFEIALGEKAWPWLEKHPYEAEIFNGAMTGFSAQVGAAVAEAYDFSKVEHLVDVGGGHGMLLSLVLQKNPKLRGTVFDLPTVIEGAGGLLKQGGIENRCNRVAGDFLKEVNVTGDAYILKSILHDWDDARSLAILKNIHRAAKPGATLLIVDGVIQPGNEPDFNKILDMEMLAVTDGGRERNEAQFRELFANAGFELQRIIPTKSPLPILEAIRK